MGSVTRAKGGSPVRRRAKRAALRERRRRNGYLSRVGHQQRQTLCDSVPLYRHMDQTKQRLALRRQSQHADSRQVALDWPAADLPPTQTVTPRPMTTINGTMAVDCRAINLSGIPNSWRFAIV